MSFQNATVEKVQVLKSVEPYVGGRFYFLP